MNILGISCFYHDAGACLLKDGKIVAAAEEERFTRKKHDAGFPINAINFCLKEGKVKIKDINYVGFYEKPLLKFERILSQHVEMFPRSFWSFYKSVPAWLNQKLRIPGIIRKQLKYKGEILFIEHHLAHAASAFLVSPFKKAAILTLDGVGEWSTSTYGIGSGNKINLEKEIRFPHSIGLLYSTVTAHLGFSVNNSEYKVMGMSAYGKPRYYEQFKKIIDVKEDGSYQLNMSYFDYHYKMKMPGKKFIKKFGPIRKPDEPVTQRHKDIAASLQKVTEEVMIKSLNHIYDITKCENVCLAGGVALNSVGNGKILSKTKFKDVWIQPAASDAGSSIGVAAYIYNCLFNKKRNFVLKTAYLGPGYSDAEIKHFLDKNMIKYRSFRNDNELAKETAKLIYRDNVIGWFQGKMEWGPRALGSRSILSNATNPKMQDILNLKVKHREKFRPFAPVVCVDDAPKYFECDEPIPLPTDFMLMVYPIKKEKRKLIPAVTHIDGSGRLQTIRKEQNPLYWNVIKQFGILSKIPILINTSFNIRGEPIVCTPYDAYKCMMGTGIDYLIIGRFLVKRSNNPRDMWDSEKYAVD